MAIWDVLPSIRAAIAEELMKRDLPQKEISRLLGITPPAVSQYLSKKRGYNIEFGEEIKVSISQLADDLVEKNIHNPVERICRSAGYFEKMRRYADQTIINASKSMILRVHWGISSICFMYSFAC